MITPNLKTCTACATNKPLTQFFRSKATKDGFQNHCRTCQAIRKRNKPDDSITAAIRADQRCVDLIKSAIKVSPRKYTLPDGTRINLQSEVAKLGYVTSPSNFSVISAGIRGELTPQQKRRQIAANELEESSATKTPKPQKNAPSVDPEMVVDVPGIFEVQNRGRGYTSFNFTSTIDGTTFSFPSFKEARQARKEMMDAFRQHAVYENTHRQSAGK